MEGRICKLCNKLKGLEEYYFIGIWKGKKYYNWDCKACLNQRVTCECGKTYTLLNRTKHLSADLYQRWLSAISPGGQNIKSILDFDMLHRDDRTYYGRYCQGCKSVTVKRPYVCECDVNITYLNRSRHVKGSMLHSKY